MGVHGNRRLGVHKVMKYQQRDGVSSMIYTSKCLSLREYLFFGLYLGVILIASWSCDEGSTDDMTSTTEAAELTPLINSNTNWLLSCNEDTDCDEGETCSCGSCVIPCEEMRGCSIDPRDMRSPRVACAIAARLWQISICLLA